MWRAGLVAVLNGGHSQPHEALLRQRLENSGSETEGGRVEVVGSDES